MLSTLRQTSLPLPPGLYIPDIERNREHLPLLLTDVKEICAVVLSRVTPDLISHAFNQGYIQLLPIQLFVDTRSCDKFESDEKPIVLFPSYLSSSYCIKDKDDLVLYKCQPPQLAKVKLLVESSRGLDRDAILHLISTQSARTPVPCQILSTLLLSVPDTREIQPCEPEQPQLIKFLVESTEPFPYGYILPHTVIELEMEKKVPPELPRIRFIPHGSVDTSVIMLSMRDAAVFGLGESNWAEFEVKQCEPLNLFEETEWLKIPEIDLVASPIKRNCQVVILHEREVVCLHNTLYKHIQEDIDKGTIICYLSSLILNTNSPFHPSWYAFYGDISRSRLPNIIANKISIRQVAMPHVELKDTFDDDLVQYFATPRLVRLGDLISVELEQYTEPLFYTVESLGTEDGRQVKEGNLIWATAMHSTLSQVGHINRQISHCFSHKNFFNSPYLYGLEKYFVQLLRYIYPLACLNHNPNAYYNNAILLEGGRKSGKLTLAKSAARLFSMNFTIIECLDLILFESPSDAEAKLVADFSAARRCRPCVLYIASLQVFTQPKRHHEQDFKYLRLARYISELVKEYMKSDGLPLVIIGATHSMVDLSDCILKVFMNVVNVTPLREQEVLSALKLVTARWLLAPSVDLKEISTDCHRFSLGNLKFMTDEVNLTSVTRSLELLSQQKVEFLPYHNLTTVIMPEDFASSLKHLREMRGNVIEAAKIPTVHWEDIGGLEKVKTEVMQTLFFSRTGVEELDSALLKFKRSGLLLHGPPGCGKTMIAKAIATESKSRFMNVKGPELLNKYVGQSEHNIRNIFDEAIESAPCIIFFDEIDSLAPKRGQFGDSGGIMDRISAQLLTELDRVAQTPNVYVVAATNRPDLLDPAILRPGRFDRSLHVGFSETAEDIEKVFRAVTKKFTMSEDVNLTEISQSMKGTFSGSQIYSICYEAMLNSLKRKVAEYEAAGRKDDYDTIITTKEDFDKALRTIFEPKTNDSL